MTSSPDVTGTQAEVAGPASLRMVGASGAVCVDGVCIIEPVAHAAEEPDKSDN